jgi:DNA-binding response OmpR family regulator
VRVLVIDDDLRWLEEAKAILVQLGSEVLAHIGPDGSLYAARRYKPDLILLDLNMPDLDGKWLLTELKKQSTAQIYFCSDAEPGRLKTLVRVVGADGIITKTEMREPGAPALRRILGKEFT